MKESPFCRHKKPSTIKKIKLLCSFNGALLPRPPFGKLRYVGGETRIISVDRNIGFLRLRSKILELRPISPSFSLKFQIPESDGVDGDVPLVLITTDEDVRFMIDEYDKLLSHGKPRRLWLFVCNDNGQGKTETKPSMNGVVGLGDRLCGFPAETEPSSPHMSRIQNSGHFFSTNSLTPKIPVIQNVELRSDDSLRKMVLEQQVIATQEAGFQSPRGFFMSRTSEREIPFPSTCSVRVQNSVNSLGEITFEPHVPSNHPTTVHSFRDSYGMNVSDYNFPMTCILNQSLSGLNSSPEPHLRSLKRNGRHLGLQGNSSIQFLPSRFGDGLANGGEFNAGCSGQSVATVKFLKQLQSPNVVSMTPGIDVKQGRQNIERVPMGVLNRENVMPWTACCDSVETCRTPVACSDQFVGEVSPLKPFDTYNRASGNYQCGVRNHRFGAGDVRNQRMNLHYMRNHRVNLLLEMGNRRDIGLDGKPCFWKCYPGLSPSSNISKHGQAVRSHHTHLWKPWSGTLEHAREGMTWMIESCKDAQPSFNRKSGRGILRERILQQSDGRYPVDHVSGQGGLLATGSSNPPKDHLVLHGVCGGPCYQPLQPNNSIENPVQCIKHTTTAEDLSSDLNHTKYETPSQTVCNNSHTIPVDSSHHPLSGKQNGHDLSKKPLLMNPQKDVELTICSIDRCCFNGSKSGDKSRCPITDKKSGLDNKTGVKTLTQNPDCIDISSGVHLSLDNLSLSISKEVEPPTLPSSPARDDVLEFSPRCEMDLQQSSPDTMDEGHLSSNPSIGNSNGHGSNCSINPAAQLRKDLVLGEDTQAEFKGSHTCSKTDGGIYNDLAAFYTHLTTHELQNIRNSDLEEIRELGSGTYGTVYYGKWKGSDVAIKRIKPSCFTGGEEDRLIADFWKEAQMLSQLHHPNVVAFYGVVTDGPVRNLATVTEFMVNGSLKNVLKRKDRTIDRRKRLIIAMDAAFGMQYLHEKNVVHFDLKSHNFLVNMKDPHRPVCKIGDLGLSKIKQRTLVSGGVRGTIPWMAPELLTGKDKMVTEKVDVYSFGIVMWELLTGDEPYADMRSEEIIAGIIKGDLRPEVPSWCDPTWRSLMESCWSSDPELRPGFPEIAKELRAMSAAINIK
ncbi:uncharacterized protein LOC122652974 isoform X2 [Telopea speciosissima]|uniref:uncharacterized protein LOC122652974 isoform X2 n=1 Tax=Telopea speciosissima TaxID=54955 RepID=UPI001CC42F7E|nr:uncharacterized protein LOC122652974 isoform X2 [Telopea speciosissima]